jgi:predicted enzyme related to lactoylglutathione lyase
MTTFWYTIIYVSSVVKTIEFYEHVFWIERVFITPDEDYGQLNTWATVLSFARHDLARSNFTSDYQEVDIISKPFWVEIGFVVADIQKCIDLALKYGWTIFADLKVKPRWQSVAYIRDPEWFLVEICTEI